MFRFLISVFGSEYVPSISIGTRVRTKWGKGTVTNGAIQVRLDKPVNLGKKFLPNTGFTVNLSDVKVINNQKGNENA